VRFLLLMDLLVAEANDAVEEEAACLVGALFAAGFRLSLPCPPAKENAAGFLAAGC